MSEVTPTSEATKPSVSGGTSLNFPLLSLSLGVLLVAVLGAFFGLASAFLGAAALTLLLVIFLVYRALVSLESDEDVLDLEEAFHLAAPLRAEEQKRALLRTLKDLDFELASGKISQKDYDDVASGVREEAKKMIATVDEALFERRHEAERLFEAFAKNEVKIPFEANPEASIAPEKKKSKKAHAEKKS